VKFRSSFSPRAGEQESRVGSQVVALHDDVSKRGTPNSFGLRVAFQSVAIGSPRPANGQTTIEINVEIHSNDIP